ncbi:hypothetical protein, partial [Aestuariicoccus sp. MJ-SS9]|uniref:hypothetical protein n=1 Tax=Aestuariicoccus sp. MJ-SS9 TaxID=3079855 RepID=UPI00291159A6
MTDLSPEAVKAQFAGLHPNDDRDFAANNHRLCPLSGSRHSRNGGYVRNSDAGRFETRVRIVAQAVIGLPK